MNTSGARFHPEEAAKRWNIERLIIAQEEGENCITRLLLGDG
jgi:hypothetical protein